MSVLLIFPPFSGTRCVGLALPTLAAYLRVNGVETKVLDANVTFLKSILREKGINEGYRQAMDRFRELDAGELALREERQEYFYLTKALYKAPRFRDDWEASLSSPIRSAKDFLNRIDAFTTAVDLVQFPYPDQIRASHMPGNDSVSHQSTSYSSRDLVDQTRHGGNSILAGFFEEYLSSVLSERQYTVVGISVAFMSQIQAALHCARAVKTIDPRVHVTLGGGFVSTAARSPTSTALFEVIDSLVIDDGEVPLLRLHEELRSPQPDLSRVPSLIYEQGGALKRTELADPLELASQPLPDYSDCDFSNGIFPQRTLQLALRASRGCSWRRCSFCRVDARFMSCRQLPPPEYAYESLRSAVKQTGARAIVFVDAEADTDVMAGLSQLIVDSKVKVSWAANFRLEPKLTLDKCMLYRRSGCGSMVYGIESYNDRVLKINRKGISVKTIDHALSNTSWAGIPAVCYMMTGLPGETEDELIDGYRALLRMKRDGLVSSYSYSNFKLQVGSDCFANPEKYGIRDVQLPEGEDLDDTAEHFAGDVLPLKRASASANLFNAMAFQPIWIQSVQIGNQEAPLRHDLRKVLFSGVEDLYDRIIAVREELDAAFHGSAMG